MLFRSKLDRLRPEKRDAARAIANANANNQQLLKAVLCAGLFPNVLKATPGKSQPSLSQQKQQVQIHPSSFNKGAPRFETGWLVYHEKVAANGKVSVHDCSPVSALDLFLFGAEPQVLHAQHRILIDGWIESRVSPRTAVLVKALRLQLSELLRDRIDADWDSEAGAGDNGGDNGGDRKSVV